MQRTIKRVTFHTLAAPQMKRVAAYARVSSDKDPMGHSLSAQISYYNTLIQKHPDWTLVGIYADEGITGTRADRPEFVRLLNDCRAGKIDMVLTKSISRFARNTVTLLETVRELKELGVDVFFEKENLHSTTGEGELMLTILASFAQEESRSASENQLWRVQKNFKEGKPWNCTMLGYRNENGQLKVVPEEAEVVRTVFRMYLDGCGTRVIAKHLNDNHILARRGNEWHEHTVYKVLKNYSYTGNLLLQQTYAENHITKKRLPNEGQLPQYHVEDAHEPIIDLETFMQVQEEIKARAEKWVYCTEHSRFPFTSLLVCEHCGKHYRRRINHGRHFWNCSTTLNRGKSRCNTKMIPETELERIAEELVGSAEDLPILVDSILVGPNNRLRFLFKNGTEVERVWTERSRADSWTPEMKEAARAAAKKQKAPQRSADGRFLPREVE